jgi:hypothetical protein
MASQLVAELDSIEFPRAAVPFNVAADAVIALLGDYDATGHLEGPWWCRVFVETPPSGLATSPLLTFVQKQRSGRIRVDFTFFGNVESPLLTSLVRNSPGISKVFTSTADPDILTSLLPDAQREFAFQAQVRFRSGVSYAARFLPSVYLTSWQSQDVLTIPVLPSDTASLSFELTPPEADEGLRYQGLQCVVKFTKWNPATNRVSDVIRIISADFKIESSLPAIIDAISPSLLFHAWVRAAQNLPLQQMQFAIPTNLKAIAPVLLEHPSLRPIIRMAFIGRSHPAMGPIFQQRLTLGSLLSLSPPTAVGAQFSYSVEVWSDCATMVQSGLLVAPERRRGNFIFVIKAFPNVFIATKSGTVTVEPGSPLEVSVSEFVAACLPLPVRIVQTKVSVVPELLAVDDEEGLPEFLQEAGLETMLSEIV